MNERLLDIWKQQDPPGDEALLKYLRGELLPEEVRIIEEQLAASELHSDAAEGLQMLEQPKDAEEITARLNLQLATQLRQQRKRSRRSLPNQSLLILVTFIVLVLLVLAFMVIYRLQQGQ